MTQAIGRPRDEAVQNRIVEAADALLAEAGYSGFSIEKLAARAGVSKTSVYRRWGSKGEIVLDLYVADITEPPEIDGTGDALDSLESYLAMTVGRLSSHSWANAIKTLVAEAQYDSALAKMVQDRVINPRRQVAGELLRQGMSEGLVRSDLDMDVALDLLFGPIWYRLMLGHLDIDRDFVASVVKNLRGAFS